MGDTVTNRLNDEPGTVLELDSDTDRWHVALVEYPERTGWTFVRMLDAA